LARLDWARESKVLTSPKRQEGQVLTSPVWQGWTSLEKTKSYPRLNDKA